MTTTKTTIWRPNVRVTLDEYSEVEDTTRGGDEGHRRKRAPPRRAVRARGSIGRSARCAALVRTGSGADTAGVRRVSNLRARSYTLSVQGVRRVSNLRARSYTLSVQGVRWVSDLRARSSALIAKCGGSQICEHGRQRRCCKVRWWWNLRHSRRRSQCKECGGASVCERWYALSVQGCGGSGV